MHDKTLAAIRDLFADINMDDVFERGGPIEGYRHRISGRTIGYQLDNAFGNEVRVDAIVKGFQEYILVIETYSGDRPDRNKFREHLFNVASLLALIREREAALNEIGGPYMFFLKHILEDAGADMHEPDNQGISMSLTGPVEFSYGGDDEYDQMASTQEWMIRRETPHPEFGFTTMTLPITVVFDMMKELAKG